MGNVKREPFVSGLPGPREPKAPPGEQFNAFCREPPCASDVCRRANRCLHSS